MLRSANQPALPISKSYKCSRNYRFFGRLNSLKTRRQTCGSLPCQKHVICEQNSAGPPTTRVNFGVDSRTYYWQPRLFR
jgi:hypothetical protein